MNGITGISNLYASSALSAHNNHVESAGTNLAQLSTGTRLTSASVDSSTSSLVNSLKSNIAVYQQAEVNARNGSSVIQLAIGAIQNSINVLSQMKVLTAQAAGGGLSTTGLSQIDTQFQQLSQQVDSNASRARWNGGSLLLGGNGTVTSAGAITASSTSIADGTNVMTAGIVAASSTGYISGTAQSVTVSANPAIAANFDISLTIADGNGGQQVFQALNQVTTNGSTLTLYSTSDEANAITVTWGTASTGVTLANLQTALNKSFGLGAGQAPASFASKSTALPGTMAMTSGSATPKGNYIISSVANSNLLKLSTGQQELYVPLTSDGAQSVTFSNGITAALDTGFTRAAGIAQSVFEVGAGTSSSLTFQLDILASDTQVVNFPAASTSALGLSGLNVTSQANARTAENAIDLALQQLNTAYSQLGASQKRLEVTASNLETTIENNQAAASVYGDVDLTAALTDFVKANTMQQVSFTAISKALQMQMDLAAFVKNN